MLHSSIVRGRLKAAPLSITLFTGHWAHMPSCLLPQRLRRCGIFIFYWALGHFYWALGTPGHHIKPRFDISPYHDPTIKGKHNEKQ